MTAFLYRMGHGFAGALTRESQASIESQQFADPSGFAAHGLPGKIDANDQFVPIASGDAAADVYGFLVRPYPFQGATAGDVNVGSVAPTYDRQANVMRRGYISVKNNAGTPGLNKPVYIRVATGTGGTPVTAGIEAEAPTTATNSIKLTNAVFMSTGDADGNVEIAYNI